MNTDQHRFLALLPARRRRYIRILSVFICVHLWFLPLQGQEAVQDTTHNLSISGPGNVKGNTTQVCVFCHVPHTDVKNSQALWSHKMPEVVYQLPSTKTIQTSVPQPDGVSLQCLGCHDGTIAVGDLSSSTIDVVGTNIALEGRLREGAPGHLGTNLSGHHPISIVYDEAAVQKNNQQGEMPLKLPAPVTWLDKDHKVQCTTCHEPHANRYPDVAPFWKTSTFDEVCLQCHEP